MASQEVDVAFAAKESHAFQWREPTPGQLVPIGHEVGHRPRRQDLPPQYQETGAFYVMNARGFQEARHRFFGRIAVQEVDADTAIEIDTWEDLRMCEAIAPLLDDKLGLTADLDLDVDALVTDFDGVHTDDRASVHQDGTESVRVSRADGLGLSRLRKTGMPILILSKEQNPVVRARAAKLQVDVLHGVDDKAGAIRHWIRENDLDAARVAYVGNDINDIPALQEVGWPIAVADAKNEVKLAARLILAQRGGDGAVREVCDRILAARQQ
ncbi:HAD hydrolase family protein [Nesterenkonia sp.]|uniref:HAD hydrolase family protein n=1 Tax=Nesterenkonia sp. TaxID=704201 RepID=UPI002602FDB1|nr:HAD hydrolase family protein [Nesterenkonia sp.]